MAYVNSDRAARRRIFHRIRNHIDNHLVHAQKVYIHIGIRDIVVTELEMHVFLFGKGTEHRNIVFAILVQVDRIQVQFHLAAFNARHIQHIVDQGQKVFTRKFRLAEAIQRLGLVINILDRHIGKANHRVKRRADVMRHVEEERALRLVCKFGFFKARHFAFCFGIDAMETGNYMVLEIFVLDKFNLVINIFTIDLQSEVDEVHVFMFDHVKYFCRFSRGAERFAIARVDNGINKHFQTFTEVVDFGPPRNHLIKHGVKAVMHLGKCLVIHVHHAAEVIGQA